mgnify:CR=1 FL=1
MAAILVPTDLAEWGAGLTLDGSSAVSTAMATNAIRRHQARFVKAAEDRNYPATACEDSDGALYDVAQDYVGLMATAQVWGAFTRGSQRGREFSKDLREQAAVLLDELGKNPDALAGAEALANGDGVPNRPNSTKTQKAEVVYKSTLDAIRGTRRI